MSRLIKNEDDRKIMVGIALKRKTIERLDKERQTDKGEISRSVLVQNIIDKWLENETD